MLRHMPSMWLKSKNLSLYSSSEVTAMVVTTWEGQDWWVCVSKKLHDLLQLPLPPPSSAPSELLPGEVNSASYSLQKHFQKTRWRMISAGTEDSCCGVSFILTDREAQGWESTATMCKSFFFLPLCLYSSSPSKLGASLKTSPYAQAFSVFFLNWKEYIWGHLDKLFLTFC